MLKRIGAFGFPTLVVLIVAVMLVPLPTSLLDLLIVTNIATAVLVLLVSMNVKRALEFSSFPSLLLILTLFRLGLNVSTSRSILSKGEAGQVVNTFGSVVVAGNLVVGMVVFFILVLVQFIVIANGASRVSEVSARFTLDAMPGKQMAIDADLNAGAIDDDEARKRRKDISEEADFYGAMDGASKFVKGDAIAAIVITAVNLFGGFVIGIVMEGMSLGESVSRYSLLTVGDGLVSQIPALLISIASGLIVTRAAGETDLGSDVLGQFSRQHKILRVGGILIAAMALIPGMPKPIFIGMGAAVFLIGQRIGRAAKRAEYTVEPEPVEAGPPSPQQLAVDARVEPVELDLAVDLVELVSGPDGDLLERIGALRRKLAMELGFVLPTVRTRDDATLAASEYRILIHGVEVGSGVAPAGKVLVIAENYDGLPGEDVTEPVFGLPARWVPVEFRVAAESRGATVVDRAALIITHLSETVRSRSGKLLSRTDVKALIDGVKATDPTVVEDLNSAGISTASVQRVLVGLLDEGVAIRDLVRILEVISERARGAGAEEEIVEAVRTELGAAVAGPHTTSGVLRAVVIDPASELELAGMVRGTERGSFLDLLPGVAETLVSQITETVEATQRQGYTPVLVCSNRIRPSLRRFINPVLPALAVLSYAEVAGSVTVEVVGSVRLTHLTAPSVAGPVN